MVLKLIPGQNARSSNRATMEVKFQKRGERRFLLSRYLSAADMSYFLNRVWMTAGVPAVNAHTDQGHKLKSGIKSFQQSKKSFTSSADPADFRPLSGVVGSEVGGHERTKQSDDSLRQVMYLSCWGPS
ncbi:hypothetical protein L6452_17371 [Arctium lappa]|uniref:Uncharacterized protein n=1 Tax=Arctium lappa TaxID=4217 RepID=A0ACB9C369_ARCLA|nr:hypothetical protein L6452_17371 [Arctium lappa]